jgi:hypothetical protein
MLREAGELDELGMGETQIAGGKPATSKEKRGLELLKSDLVINLVERHERFDVIC